LVEQRIWMASKGMFDNCAAQAGSTWPTMLVPSELKMAFAGALRSNGTLRAALGRMNKEIREDMARAFSGAS